MDQAVTETLVQAATPGMSQTLIDSFLRGGIFMWPILAVSLIATFIALERYLALSLRFGIDGRRIFSEVKKFLVNRDWTRALETCRQYPLSPLARVLGAGVESGKDSLQEVETAMESETLYHAPKITERITYLSVLANIATLLGLLGTISGLISSFFAVNGAEAELAGRGTALASGIAEAMFTTAFGLIVAIPIMLAHAFLSSKANRLLDDIEHYASSLKKLLQRIHANKDIPRDDDLAPATTESKASYSIGHGQVPADALVK